jgi:hypothetical protein
MKYLTRRRVLLVIAAVILINYPLIALTGCASQIDRIPARADFERPLEEVYAENPAFHALFLEHRKEAGDAYPGMVYADVFAEAYGEPDSWRFSWWTLFPFNWPIAPQTLWFWQLGEHKLQARVDHPFYEGFTPIICDLQWVE